MQFQSGIGEHIRDAILRKSRPDRSHQYATKVQSADDKPTDHNLVAGLHKAATGDVSQARVEAGVEIIKFHQTIADCFPRASQDHRVRAGRELGNNGCLGIISGWDARGFDLGLLSIFPIIVGLENGPGGIVQLEDGIGRALREH